MTACHWRKAKTGQWVVVGPIEIVKAGATVDVAKRDGSVSQVDILTVGAMFTAKDGTAQCYGYTSAPRRGRGKGGKGDTPRPRTPDPEPAPVPAPVPTPAPVPAPVRVAECSECGDPADPDTRCWETGLMHWQMAS